MAWRCYISNFRSLGCQEAHQEGPYPPSPGWILGGQMVPDALPGGSWWPGGATFQISNLIIILLKLSPIDSSYCISIASIGPFGLVSSMRRCER